MIGAALAYASKAIRVLPLEPGGKRPICSHGVHDATTDVDTIRSWWTETPSANIGIAIGVGALEGVRVVDADIRSGGDSTLAQLILRHGRLPETIIVETATGGTHHFFGWRTERARSKVGQGVDLLGPGRYVVAPPSVREGGQYRSLSAKGTPIADAPAWLVDLAREPDPTTPVQIEITSDIMRRAKAYLDAVPPAIEGQGGDDHTFIVAQRLVRGFGLQVGDAFDLLLDWNCRCEPPWSGPKLLRKVMEASKAGRMPMGSLLERRSA